ncbi:hypothetical protein C8A03DRAFT_40670 [Achaetomium macrosporum]|uniref:Rad60/SUMO-like domain-containing protein n=1 Tax=Achaetomium macrosporum TaxID=79813 RepID=A0AAN7CIJ4_9PEZI|nr:hypothetical protein C8A03DRAFT_40670 [Achaetomium macrosporum]
MADLAEPPKKRALPFKRTVARKQQSSVEPEKAEDDNDLDLFRHSKEVFPEILREAEEEDKRQHDRKRRKTSLEDTPRRTNRRVKHSSRSSDDLSYAHKRSISLDESDDDLIMDAKGKGKEIIRARTMSVPRRTVSRKTTPRTPGRNGSIAGTTGSRYTPGQPDGSPAFPVTIPNDDDDDDVIPLGSPAPRRKSSEDLNPRLQDAQDDNSSSVELIDNSKEPGEGEVKETIEQDEFSEWVRKARELQARQSHDAIVNIFVESRVPGASKPILVKRRLNQTFQLILDVWVATTRGKGIEIPDDVASSLFLTWKGNKIYGHSTLASLGVEVDEMGNLKRSEGDGYFRGGLQLEIWNEEAYAEYLKHRGKERALKLGADDGDLSAAESEDEPLPPPPKKKGIKIVLKAKEHEPLKLMTRDETNVEMLIEAFRAQRNIGPEWDVAIHFDGERLDEDALVTDIDVDPDDVNQLEVHIKKASH